MEKQGQVKKVKNTEVPFKMSGSVVYSLHSTVVSGMLKTQAWSRLDPFQGLLLSVGT